MQTLAGSILLALGVVVVIAIIAVGSIRMPNEIAHAQFALSWIGQVIGLFLTTIAAVMLLFTGLGLRSESHIPALAAAATTGLLLIAPHWSLGIALAVIVVAITSQGIWHRSRFPADREV